MRPSYAFRTLFAAASVIMPPIRRKETTLGFRGGTMIRLDLAKLSRAQLEREVRQHCSAFGAVASVVIVQDSENFAFALAAVEILDPAHRMAVLRQIGDSLVDQTVVIRIEQQ
jgi:hypothetical protein